MLVSTVLFALLAQLDYVGKGLERARECDKKGETMQGSSRHVVEGKWGSWPAFTRLTNDRLLLDYKFVFLPLIPPMTVTMTCTRFLIFASAACRVFEMFSKLLSVSMRCALQYPTSVNHMTPI